MSNELNEILSKDQMGVLEAAVNRVIPADDFPSGWEAGVGDFIVRLIGRSPKFVPIYQRGLDGLEAEATGGYGAGFADLDDETRDRLLKLVERGEVKSSWSTSPTEFFRVLVDQTMEGYYADPGNGGNRNSASWKMVGFEVTA